MKLVFISCILISMATLSARATDDSVSRLAEDARCARGLDWIAKNSSWVTEQQMRLSEIPAPEFGEAERGKALAAIFQSAGLKVRTDEIGNVIGESAGSEPGVVLFVAHLDTVFPAGTDVSVKRDGTRLVGAGISDNAAGLGALAGLARALSESRVKTKKTIALAGDVGEEGEGNLRGVRALVDSYGSRLSAVIAVDGPSTDYITTQGIASRRFEVTVTGPGGHSWSDFGEPNPITALARGIVKFSSIRIPENPRSSFNFGVIEGGTSVNSIPARTSVKVDLRSEDESELNRLEASLRDAMTAGVRGENAASPGAGDDYAQLNPQSLEIKFTSLGTRPAGKLPSDSPLLATMRSVDSYLGNRARLERSSTDANIPLSLGIPAVAVGGGGRGGGSHTPEEWYDPTGRDLGLKRLYLAAIALAGLSS
ncbi:MAG TPA: M20/M25/M40 family metallo-hydrolase [Candidatus Baltobacteraceae bacterium]|nr:M20/M25/M40 family metallo-hydrolase [Candidatus Baltobacteraceae bacterium]